MSADLAAAMRPFAEPIIYDNVYTDDQYRRLIEAVRREGPWELVLAQHFASAEELIATMSGMIPEGVTPTFDMFVTAVFRGYLAMNGTCMYPELEDCFYNSDFLARVRSYWKADYARPDELLFNIQGPSHCLDPAHIDGASFRGITLKNTPVWLMNTMGKSGLFKRWMLKKAQVISWFYPGKIGGGFTYWPEGPLAQPKRIATPMWNRGVIVQNDVMYHRGESNGPLDQRHPQGLAFNSLFDADPAVADGWQITTDGEVIQRIPASETRFLVHWNAEVYEDLTELKKVMDQTDNLTHEQVFDLFIKDLRTRGLQFEMPNDPLHDRDFIRLLSNTYDLGTPRFYPADAPGPQQQAA